MPTKRMNALQAKYTNMAAKVEDDISDMSDESFETMVKVSEGLATDISLLAIEVDAKNRPVAANADDRALRVLTPPQRARLRALQGAKFAG
jgi:hypothetical protein